ncbi:MAG: hypothetical protein A3F33_00735 [Candidatus Woykebacteria bacterium RIFCSPHIGHO2_12_FULL_43_10]|uniref:mannose-1-phosphate guanylyltransferase n=2 Tax=Candidatus Woykeibacteriota TaxID=1817899 RepID=A0A1G1WVR5_9BACT|nr:MAG: hypothetical protein A3J50_00745 [Candidatus Woykebacteria bacterium RIFCSPHIGHO2_02_FULL_43_16b]OGY28999.1 MAG: hypothetical protein A3F33_00735 [Candidatus Woykebacteria bacterium RIFCSPHIGHO2_12_FULL_43_10]OGY31794.1 MAG: hypothetical protein A3A61_02230 [Candidatus Woykebacteria bacterium RIFCSPLOWO2_01_FULL_43_14]
MNTNDIYAVIMAGGGGSRLWPKSRNRRPKQFLKLISSKTMLQETVDRIRSLVNIENVFVVTSAQYVNEVKSEINGLPEENILTEPQAKNTAIAIGLAAAKIYKLNPKAVIATLASDHLIKNPREFRSTLLRALKAASKGNYLVTIGIHPTEPHIGFGYIHSNGLKFKIDSKPVFNVESFTEKPNLVTAQAYIATGLYFWNANINAYSASSILEAFKTNMPKLYKGLTRIRDSFGKSDYQEVVTSVYENAESIAIDTGILEKANNVLMVPGDFGWSDIGSWKELHELSPISVEGNVMLGDESGEHLFIDTKNCLIHSSGRLVATIGVEDLIIVDTVDALLVCPKDRAQEVKSLVERIKKEKRVEYL